MDHLSLENLPHDVLKQILPNDIKTVWSLIHTSAKLRSFVQTHIKHLTSDEKHSVTYPIHAFIYFQNLETVDDRIILVTSGHGISLNLPKLRKATFDIGNHQRIKSLETKIRRIYDVIQKIPDHNYKILGQVQHTEYLTTFHKDRFMAPGSMISLIIDLVMNHGLTYYSYDPAVVTLILEDHPSLANRIVGITEVGSDSRMLMKNLKDFLREGNFGLVDPSDEMSETNPPISLLTTRIADSGLWSCTDFAVLYGLYVLYSVNDNSLSEEKFGPILNPIEIFQRFSIREPVIFNRSQLDLYHVPEGRMLSFTEMKVIYDVLNKAERIKTRMMAF